MTANVLHRPDCVRGTCWPGPPLVGMLIYSTVVTLYLAYLGFAGRLTGTFLWPAVALHLILSTFLGRAWFSTEMPSRSWTARRLPVLRLMSVALVRRSE
jgi:hypothetical protein